MLTDRTWLRTTAPALALLAAVVVATPARGQTAHHTAISPDKIEWKPGPPTLPPGTQMAVLAGSPLKDGPFIMRLKFPAGFVIPPHRHPREEALTVISGGFGMGIGEKHDRNAAPLLPAGGFFIMPAGAAHFAWTERETVTQVNGIGPFVVEYINPDDDPRKKQAGSK
jgi:hypothetical protein